MAIELEDESEVTDVCRIISDAGLTIEQFDIQQVSQPIGAGGPNNINCTILVQFFPTGRSKTYLDLFGTSWVAEFRKDCESGLFNAGYKA